MIVLNTYKFNPSIIHFDYRSRMYEFKSYLRLNDYVPTESEEFIPVWKEPNVRRICKE